MRRQLGCDGGWYSRLLLLIVGTAVDTSWTNAWWSKRCTNVVIAIVAVVVGIATIDSIIINNINVSFTMCILNNFNVCNICIV